MCNITNILHIVKLISKTGMVVYGRTDVLNRYIFGGVRWESIKGTEKRKHVGSLNLVTVTPTNPQCWIWHDYAEQQKT